MKELKKSLLLLTVFFFAALSLTNCRETKEDKAEDAIEEVEEGPSIMMQAAKPERGGRGERAPSGRAAESRSDAANDDKRSAEKQPAEENAGE